uniref:Uncharacterized protein n=1 Tax=viral metagenome TaxID=1070528 RepID=A0A6C0AZ77_9ZZZZ
MGKNLNISVLVAARDEYISQLKCIILPLLIQGFNSIYNDAINISNNKNTIYKFQELLKQIPQWNQTILQEESKRIKKKCPYIMDIVTAIFVTNVKILASVRLKGSKDDIRVKIPTSDIFLHGIYIAAAERIFYDPFLFYHKHGNKFGKIQENRNNVKQIISYAVDETIRYHLPFDDILQKYLADALNGTADHSDSESESGEESVSDSDEESIGNDNLPSDEDSEPDEPELDASKVKSFSLNEKGGAVFGGELETKEPFMFQNENDSDSDSDTDSEVFHEPPKQNSFIPPVEHQFMSNTSPSYPPPPPPPPQVPQQQSYPVPPQQQNYQAPPQVPQQQNYQAPQENKFSFFS